MSWMTKMLRCYWRYLLALITPVLLLPFPAILGNYLETRCAYVILIMVVYWTTEALPLPVTAIIPIFAFPILGVLSTKEVCLNYMQEPVMMFLVSMILGVALTESGLDRRIAAFSLLKIGKNPRLVLGAFMAATMFLSLWISNAAATAVMIPTLEAVLDEMDERWKPPKNMVIPKITITDMEENKETSWGEVNEGFEGEFGDGGDDPEASDVESKSSKSEKSVQCQRKTDSRMDNFRRCLYLSVAYSASIGGTGLLPSSNPNLILHQILTKDFAKPTYLSFNTWMALNIPGMILCTFAAWVWFQYLYFGIQRDDLKISTESHETKNATKKILQARYDSLGPFSFHEGAVLTTFSLLTIIWIFRTPGNFPGWSHMFHSFYRGNIEVTATSAVALAVFLLFLIPANLPQILNHNSTETPTVVGCILWNEVHKRMPWTVVLLIGAGFAIADAFTTCGLASGFGRLLLGLKSVPVPFLSFFLSVITILVTNLVPGCAVATTFLPLFKNMSLAMCSNPLYTLIPATTCSSFGFMLPVASSSNAMVFYSAGNIGVAHMMKVGLGMSIICIVVTSLLINTIGVSLFDLNDLPGWVNSTTSGHVSNC